MQYVMKQKLFSWGDDFTIKDAQGNDAYFVDGKAFTLGNQLSFQDMRGNELAYIKQKLLSLRPTYELYHGGDLIAVVQKSLFTPIRCHFSIDVPGPDDLMAEGDFFGHEYTFSRRGLSAAQVSKQWFAWSDTYGVRIADGEDPVLLLASTVVIDMACHADDGRRR